MAEMSAPSGPAMTTRYWNTRCWSGLALGALAVVMMQLVTGATTGRFEEPWPMLLSSEPPGIVPGYATLQQRANLSLDNLVQPARQPDAPL